MVEYIKALYGLYMPSEKFEGQGLVEYALILALIAVAAIVIMGTLGDQIEGIFTRVSGELGGAGSS